MKCVLFFHTVDLESANFAFADSSIDSTSMKVVVGALVGGVAMVGLIAIMTALIIVTRRGKRNYEKIPLLSDKYVTKN